MKKMRRFAAIAAAAAMTACMAVPMMTVWATETTSKIESGAITITNTVSGHTYQAYQLFDGDLAKTVDDNNTPDLTTDDSTTYTFSNVTWGSNVNESEALYTALAAIKDASEAAVFVDDDGNALEAADKVAEKLQGASSDVTKAFAAVMVNHLKGDPLSFTENKTGEGEDEKTTGYTATINDPGYYLVRDEAGSLTNDHSAYTSYIVQVLGNVTIGAKSSFPTVDKQVYDNNDGADITGDNNGWFETADHAINESFQFKLTATIPANDYLADYETYKLVFTDTMSEGVTFESIESVKIGSATVNVYSENNTNGYVCTATDKQAGGAWTLTIEDILEYDVDLTDANTTIEVIYNAHLNEKAQVLNVTGGVTNKNTVGLQYSNNPNLETELGKTPDDSVWVSTYKILNTKVDGSNNKVALPGVTFKLQDANGAEIKLAYDTEKKVYYPKSDGAAVLTSGADGKFDIVGLDVGTYTLVELDPLPGYNRCEDTTIVISATHEESGDGTAATATIDATKSKGMNNEIINNQGSTLPSTGGIGTTLFYVIGGTLAAGAGVALIAKKRMKNEE